MTKAEIAQIVSEKVGLTRKESAELVESVIAVVCDTLAAGEDVKISGFGHFMVRQKHERRGRNPKTGEEIMIEPRKVVTFRASHLLKKQMGAGFIE